MLWPKFCFFEISPWFRIFIEKLLVSQLAKKFPIYMEPKCSFPYSQKPEIGSYPDPLESSLQAHNLFLGSIWILSFHIA